MRLSLAMAFAATLFTAFADTLTLRSGKVVNGTYLGGNSRQIRMEVSDRVETFDVNDVSGLQFQTESAATREAPRERVNLLRPSRTEPAKTSAAQTVVEIPAGTVLTVRMIDAVDSEVNQVGQTFQAAIDEPVMSGTQTVIPRGADVLVKLVDDKQSGKISGRTELTLDVVSLKMNGKVIDVNTQEVTTASESRSSKSGKVIGGATALGAIIGAIAGGGKGAAVGAVSGAGAGTAVQVLTKGQRVKIPPETRLTFTLQNPVRL
ncbi:MAG: hypothetical protein ACRD8O_21665 [Bryobacteraceae bacterium]